VSARFNSQSSSASVSRYVGVKSMSDRKEQLERTGPIRVEVTQEWVAKFASDKFSDSAHERTIDERMVRQWNKDFQVNWKHWSDKVNRRN
jgi:hypothetical protein